MIKKFPKINKLITSKNKKLLIQIMKTNKLNSPIRTKLKYQAMKYLQ